MTNANTQKAPGFQGNWGDALATGEVIIRPKPMTLGGELAVPLDFQLSSPQLSLALVELSFGGGKDNLQLLATDTSSTELVAGKVGSNGSKAFVVWGGTALKPTAKLHLGKVLDGAGQSLRVLPALRKGSDPALVLDSSGLTKTKGQRFEVLHVYQGNFVVDLKLVPLD